jgi:hypothetical protein
VLLAWLLSCAGPVDDVDGDGFTVAQGDCDDLDPSQYPGAEEDPRDTEDSDCDGSSWDYDWDQDGFTDDVDCDDLDPSQYPGAEEDPRDTEDSDCDGSSWDYDWDQDGFTDDVDCDDHDPTVNPEGVERCNHYDDDCDGVDDDGAGEPVYVDADHDQYGAGEVAGTYCDAPDGFAATADDCDDADPMVNPGTPEACNGIDDDCDGAVDEEQCLR